MNSKEILMPALRQYRHNRGEGFIPGYEYEEANEIVKNLLTKKASSCDWFEELYSGSQKKIISLTEEHNLAHPREYGSAADVLLDIRRVS